MSNSNLKPINLLLVEDDDEFRDTCATWMERKGHTVVQAADAHAGLFECSRKQFDVAVVDLNMPGMTGLELLERLRADEVEMEVIMLTGQASVDTAVQAMKLGASDYLSKPFPLPELEKRCQLAWESSQLKKENRQLKAVIERSRPKVRMVGDSPQKKQVHRLTERAGPTDKAILIQGDSGTDKELVARGLQSCSLRSDKPFVTINRSALPEQLVESELFGHEKGSFTGATATKPGLFEVADGSKAITQTGHQSPECQKLEDLERAHVVNILRRNHGNNAQAARALGIHRRKLYRLLERFNIEPDETGQLPIFPSHA